MVLPGIMLGGLESERGAMLGGIDRGGGRLEGPGSKPTRTVRGARLGGIASEEIGSDFGAMLEGGGTVIKLSSSGTESAAITRPVLKTTESPSSWVRHTR